MRNRKIMGIVVGVLVVAIVAFLGVGLIFPDSFPGRMLRGATVPPGGEQPTYSEAVVDGNIGEWDLASDFFSDMYRAGVIGKPLEAKLYLRYDCGANIMYVLVMSAGDWPVLVQTGEAWVAIGSMSNKVSFINFAWVDQGYDGNSGHARGWEASFSIVPGNYVLWAHINTDHGGSQTAGTPKNGLGITIECYDPTVVFLGAFAAKVAEDGSALIFWETTSEVDNLGFNLYHSTSKEGPWTKLNDALIPSQVPPGSDTGATYEWSHRDIDPKAENFYLLEDVDASGVVTQHGPITP